MKIASSTVYSLQKPLPGRVTGSSRVAFGHAAQAPFSEPPANPETPKWKQKLGNVLGEWRQYFVPKLSAGNLMNNIISDVVLGTVLGGILAIGSPMIVATAPTAILMCMAISLTMRTLRALAR